MLLMECSQAPRAKIYSPLTGIDPEMGAEATIQMDSFTSGVYGATDLFGQVLEQILEQLQPPKEVLLLQICR